MITTHYTEKPSRIRKFAFFDIFYPSAINTNRNLMLRFTGDSAGVTANTFAVVYDESKVHFVLFCGQCKIQTNHIYE
jgi:hypothetical protein